MLADERRTQILKLIKEKNFVSIKEMLTLFDVTEMTIRRD